MPRLWTCLCAWTALTALLVPPHACCLRLAMPAAPKACCCCEGEGENPHPSHPAPTRQAPCCQKADPATPADRPAPVAEAPSTQAPVAWFVPGQVCCLANRELPEAGAWPAGPPGRRTHLVHCRFNC